MKTLRVWPIWAAFYFCCTMALSAAVTGLSADGHNAVFRATDDNGDGIGGVVLALTPLDGQSVGAVDMPKTDAVLDQVDTSFDPEVVLVRQGGMISLRNSDPFNHHVYSFSDAKQFDAVMRAKGPEKQVVMDQPGVVAVGCNIHDQMRGFVYVIGAPYFRETDEDGGAVFDGLAPGRYLVQPWHPRLRGRLTRWEQEISVGESTEPVELALSLRSVRREGAGRGKERKKY